MAQGRSTQIISMIQWIRTSRLSSKNALSRPAREWWWWGICALQGYLGMKKQLPWVGSMDYPPPEYSTSPFEVRSVASGDLPLQTRSNAPDPNPIKLPLFKPDRTTPIQTRSNAPDPNPIKRPGPKPGQTPPIQTRSSAPDSVHEWIPQKRGTAEWSNRARGRGLRMCSGSEAGSY